MNYSRYNKRHAQTLIPLLAAGLLVDHSQLLPDPDLLASLGHKPKPFRCFKDEHDRASELEPSHLLPCGQRLTPEERRRLRVDGLGESMRRVLRVSFVRSKVLRVRVMRRRRVSDVSARLRWDRLTLSKLMQMLPTFVAPTGTIPKNPYLHRPRTDLQQERQPLVSFPASFSQTRPLDNTHA